MQINMNLEVTKEDLIQCRCSGAAQCLLNECTEKNKAELGVAKQGTMLGVQRRKTKTLFFYT